MFRSASAFNQPIGTWNVGAITDMSGMFYFASAFNQPLSGWERITPGNVSTVSHVTSMMYMFRNATAFNQPLGTWNVSAVTNMSYMFHNIALSSLNYDNLLTGWAALSAPTVRPNVTFSG